MTEAQIKHMVDRFLGWRLPKDFNPDAGISYTPTQFAKSHPDCGPTGTNLFDADQANTMVRYMVDGLPVHPLDQPCHADVLLEIANA